MMIVDDKSVVSWILLLVFFEEHFEVVELSGGQGAGNEV